MSNKLAGLLVFLNSFVVLVLEIVAGRLLAPYVGVTLETFSTIIGVVLAGIAAGTWAGGRLADRVSPRRLLGPLMVVGGLLTFLIIPVIRVIGPNIGSGSLVGLMFLTFVALWIPAASLSAVSPTVVKLQLQDLASTGEVVGRLSAMGTAGALAGSFSTGFLFVATLASTTIVILCGAVVTLAGLAMWVRLGRPDRSLQATVLALVAVGTGLNLSTSGPCQVESNYFCARVVVDEEDASGRYLILDTLRHSYVDLDDPTHLEFGYTLAFGDVVDGLFADRGPIDALHVGGGGFSFPRWIEATRPGSDNLVFELDPTLVELVESDLGLVTNERLRVRTGDARTGILGQDDDRFDLVVGDAFGGLAVPWHLATQEFVAEIDRVLRPGGVYVANVIDYPPLGFARAELATLQAVFEHVALVVSPDKFAGENGGNLVLVASDEPIDAAAIEALAVARGDDDVVYVDDELTDWVSDAEVLTDEFAPVDQLLSSPS